MDCKICNASTQTISNQLVLGKYNVNYHQCSNCGFVQTDKPLWLKEAYENAITSLDLGLISRNQYLLDTIPNIIDTVFPDSKNYIDYGGGYGMFVRMMRDSGYNFYRQDIYCENLFAKYFDVTNTELKTFDVLTAFEVFEHLENPLEEIEKMFAYSDNIVFSTNLLPDDIRTFNDWWYVAPQTGQHISFYTVKSFDVIAKKFSKYYYTNKNNMHLLTSQPLSEPQIHQLFKEKNKSLLSKLFSSSKKTRKSLLQPDVEFVKSKL